MASSRKKSSTCYLIGIEERKGEGEVLGPYSTRAKAIQALLDYLNEYRDDEDKIDITYEDEFGGKIAKGTHYNEEQSIEVFSRKMS